MAFRRDGRFVLMARNRTNGLAPPRAYSIPSPQSATGGPLPEPPGRRLTRAPWRDTRCAARPSVVGKLEDGQLAAQVRVVGKRRVSADGAETGRADDIASGALVALVDGIVPALGVVRIKQSGRQPDAGPAADARQNGDVLLAVMLVGGHVADDAGRRLELVEFLAGLH